MSNYKDYTIINQHTVDITKNGFSDDCCPSCSTVLNHRANYVHESDSNLSFAPCSNPTFSPNSVVRYHWDWERLHEKHRRPVHPNYHHQSRSLLHCHHHPKYPVTSTLSIYPVYGSLSEPPHSGHSNTHSLPPTATSLSAWSTFQYATFDYNPVPNPLHLAVQIVLRFVNYTQSLITSHTAPPTKVSPPSFLYALSSEPPILVI